MYPECDHCPLYGVGDTCEECQKHRRQLKRRHEDWDAENYNDGEHEVNYDDDDEYNY